MGYSFSYGAIMQYFSTLMMLLGCSNISLNPEPVQKPIFQEEIFKPYVSTFEKELDTNAQDINTKFEKITNNTTKIIVGKCFIDNKTIIIDPDFWDKAKDCEREEIIFHELGHCALKIMHNTNIINLGDKQIPESIMYPYIFCLNEYRNYYFKELKTFIH